MRERPTTGSINQFLRAPAWFKCVFAAAAVAVLGAASASAINQVTFTATGKGNNHGEVLSASVMFQLSISGTVTNLVITLENTATFKPNDQADILTAVFFNLPGDPTLTKVSGVLGAGSVGVEDGHNLTVPGGVVGGSWAYASDLWCAPDGANEGVSAASFNLFSPKNLFPGAALPGDWYRPGGVAGGLTTATDTGGKCNESPKCIGGFLWPGGFMCNGGLSDLPLIKNTVVLTLDDLPVKFRLQDISDVSVQYGPSLRGYPNIDAILETIPEPGTAMLTAFGAFLLALLRRKRS
jgi:hypothetical protein